MCSDIHLENLSLLVRERLTKENVKLWLEPYYIEDLGIVETEIKVLANNYATALGINPDMCLSALLDLQSNALEKLKERKLYRETGVATFKLRVPSQYKVGKQMSVSITLDANGSELLYLVAGKLEEDKERIKLIFNGRVLRPEESLARQGLKNGSQLMAVILHGDPTSYQSEESRQKVLETTIADARMLASRKNPESDLYLELADQSGNRLHLPAEERRALIVAMSLHEKGRAALKNQNFALALVLLLEADKEFSTCNSQILQSVDNYALLNLDIAWSYMCLKSVTYIPDAEERLKKCEQSFHKSYGPNLERLLAVKGTTGKEAALFMRLHLLQAVVAFHQNKIKDANILLGRAEQELKALKVDDTSLCTLLELGYSPAEARLGLRAAHGNIDLAVQLITQRRDELEEARKKEIAERKLEKERKKLGHCANGQWIEPHLFNALVGMGFSKHAAKIALKNTNNNVALSIQYIQDNPEAVREFIVTKEHIDQVIALGFDPRMAKAALKICSGDIDRAVNELISSDGIIATDDLDEESGTDNSESSEASTSSGSSTSFEARAKRLLEEKEAYERLSEGIATNEDDHLDLTLDQEEAFLVEYKSLLATLSSSPSSSSLNS